MVRRCIWLARRSSVERFRLHQLCIKSQKNCELVCILLPVEAIIVGIIPTLTMNQTQFFSFPTSGTSWQQLVLVLLIAPALEEFFLRHGVQKWLRDSHPSSTRSVLIPALLFGLMHLPRSVALAVWVLPLGLLSGALYQRLQSWRLCAFLHSIANGLWLLFVNFKPKEVML
jgi:membrane protease YdiL (CAAX protease family)